MSVSDRGPEANFSKKFSEPIIGRGCFDGLFLQGVAPAGHWNGGRDGGGGDRFIQIIHVAALHLGGTGAAETPAA